MGLPVFNLQDSLIVYGNGNHAYRAVKSFDQIGGNGGSHIFGMSNFTDDCSVHADHWERHPSGDEMLCVLEGRLLATVDRDGAAEDTVIEAGQVFIVPRCSWHRLRVLEPGRLLFLTPTAGVQRRPHAARGATEPA